MKKILLAALLCGASSSAFADNSGMNTKIEGLFNFESGSRLSQSHVPSDSKKISSYRDKFAFDTEACLAITASNTVNDMTYGARLGIQTSNQPRTSVSYAGSHIFLTNDNYGKLELGAARSANDTMAISAFDIVAGSGDHWDRYVYTPTGERFESSPVSDNAGSDSDIIYGPESSRKITYYTPHIKETFRFGISYIPDLSNVSVNGFGTDSTSSNKKRNIYVPIAGGTNSTLYQDQETAKDVLSYALTMDHSFGDNFDVKASISGENSNSSPKSGTIKTVDAKGDVVSGTSTSSYKLKKYSAYLAGLAIDIGKISVAGGYEKRFGFTSPIIDGNKKFSEFYNGAIAYKQGPATVSLLYSVGNDKGNRLTSYTFGTEYKLAPGFVPYFEITRFSGKGKKLFVTGNTDVFKSQGTVALIGATVKF